MRFRHRQLTLMRIPSAHQAPDEPEFLGKDLWLDSNLGSPVCSCPWPHGSKMKRQIQHRTEGRASVEEQERGFKDNEFTFCCLFTKSGAEVRALIPP